MTTQSNILSEIIKINIHFYDVDSVKIVWHGNYLKYLENGREAFGKKYGIAYMDVYRQGYVTPIVDLHIRYLSMVAYEETLVVKTVYVPSKSAKMIFHYTIYRESDMSVVVEADTTQLFMSKDGVFEVSAPSFFREWRQKWNV
ncbi:MAG: acyl-CoA thioesterase [Prevotellaceae bacterium]|jgi:acyl-CoA thioester hydrolase|nr:acyl-CoA thioesterase [Prevotellaceae bacterium]